MLLALPSLCVYGHSMISDPPNAFMQCGGDEIRRSWPFPLHSMISALAALRLREVGWQRDSSLLAPPPLVRVSAGKETSSRGCASAGKGTATPPLWVGCLPVRRHPLDLIASAGKGTASNPSDSQRPPVRGLQRIHGFGCGYCIIRYDRCGSREQDLVALLLPISFDVSLRCHGSR